MPVIPAVTAVGSLAGGAAGIMNALKKPEEGQTVTAEQMMPGWQSQTGQNLSSWINSYLNNFVPGQSYTGNLSAGMTDLESTGLDKLKKILAQPATGDLFAAGKGQVMDTLAGKYANPNTSPFIKSMMTLNNQNTQDAINASRRSAGSRGGYFSSGAMRDEADINTRSLNNLQGIIGNFVQGERNNMLNAATTAQNMDQYGNLTAPLAQVTASQSLGSLSRTLEQADLERQYQDFLRQRDEQALPVSAAGSLYGTNTNYGLKSFTGPSVEQNSTMGNILGIISKLNLGALGGSGSIWDKIGGVFKG